ncbi:MAG: hypothetical protein PVH11_09315 [Anaerolineae bacterium]|jgi:hypothetical protein
MAKKVLLGTLLVGLIGILVAGAIIRTVDKTDNVAEARGEGNGRALAQTGSNETAVLGQGRGGAGQGQGGNGQGGSGNVERQYPNYETAPEAWSTYEATVVQAPDAGVDLVVVTDDGEELVVGTGPGYMETQGFALQTGERVQVLGYWEDGELKAAQLTRLRDGETVALRDEYGRPAWSGSGRLATERQAGTPAASAGGQGGYAAEGRVEAPGGGTGEGLAEVDGWFPVSGTVTAVDATALTVQMTDGSILVVDGRSWSYAQEQGFRAEVGDQITLLGFDEDGEFEVGQLTNQRLTVQIREDSGRPLWAGRGRRGG